MTNHQDTTTTNQASGEGQQPHNDNNVNVNLTGTAVTGSSSPKPPAPTPMITDQVNVGGPSRGSPSVRGSMTPVRNSPSGRGSSTPKRGSPSGRMTPSGRSSSSCKKSPPSGRRSPSSGGRGSSSASHSGSGHVNPIGGRNFTPFSVDITVGGGGSTTARGNLTRGGSPQCPKRKAPEVIAPEGVNPVCSVCKRSNFCSWKALFGHMRCHPERQWRGCFPPPGFEEAQQALLQGEGLGRLRGLDLNEASDPEENEGGGRFDLNMLPPGADDMNDDNKDDGGGGATDRGSN